MANIAVIESSPSNNFPFGRVQSDVRMKRKSPSEPRGEQLKPKNGQINSDLNNVGATSSLKKNDPVKVPKYVDSRVNEVYPVKKSSERCRMLYGKEKSAPDAKVSRMTYGAVDSYVSSGFSVRGQSSRTHAVDCSGSSADEIGKEGFRKVEKCTQTGFQSVGELHYGKEKPSDVAETFMQKALKGFVVRNIPTSCTSLADSGKHDDAPSVFPSSSEFSITGQRAPLDFTLKTTMRLVSSSSVKWCHRLSSSPATISVGQFTSQSCCNKDQMFNVTSGSTGIVDIMYSKALRSWVYPQSSLPTTIVSAMSLSTVKEEKDFLLRRQQNWEESFRSLYYMLRKSLCNIFYVRTTQFVVMFTGGNFLGKKRSCNAYLSQSTLGLRSLLKKNGIHFSMPLCRIEVEQAADDDLVELSEIRKRNLGQTVHMDSMSDADSSPQSLLAFIGNENAHGLYDFLLNYRFLLNSFTGVDVPTLYAPVPFQNASLSVPEVRCKEVKRADVAFSSSIAPDTEDSEASPGSSSSAVCYSIEIEDTILPPWIVCGVCAAMCSDGRSFEASFAADSSSVGLNIALDSLPSASLPEDGDALGIPYAVPSRLLCSASLKRLIYSDSSYLAYVTPI